MASLLEKLSGGDKRSIGKVNEIVSDVIHTPALFGELFSGLYSQDDLVKMRAADAIEKIASIDASFIQKYKDRLLGQLEGAIQKEIRWHLAQLMPRLIMTRRERHYVIAILYTYLEDSSSIVNTMSLQAIVDLSIDDKGQQDELMPLLIGMAKNGRPAVSKRANKLLPLFKKKFENTGFDNIEVGEVFNRYPENIREKLIFLRQLIYDTATEIPEVGELDEALKWGEPAYITAQSKSGSTIRLGWKASQPSQYMMYFNCKTSLVGTFKEIYGVMFKYGGNRALIFEEHDDIPVDALSDCIAQALTYHVTRKRNQ